MTQSQEPTPPYEQKEKDVISIKSARISVTIPEEMEEQILLAGAALGCKGKSDIIATALRLFILTTHSTVQTWIERKAVMHSLPPKTVIDKAIKLYKVVDDISDEIDPSL